MSEWQELPFDRPSGERRAVLSVSELSARIKSAIESKLGFLAVEGEISNCKQWSSGHIYFTLKDD